MRGLGIGALALSLSIGVHALVFYNADFSTYEAGKSDKNTSVTAKFRKVVPPKKVPEIPKPKPKPKKVVQKKKPVPEPEPIVEPEEEIIEEVAQLDDVTTEREKKHYLSLVMDCIERCKYYPTMARRRGISGEIEVNMTLLPNGEVENLEIDGGHGILCDAVREAVMKASPLPPPPGNESYPVRIKIDFALK